MKVIILCGGKGMRIREVSAGIPKPMLFVGDRPIVWHIMKSYAAYGFKKFILCLGHNSWAIKEFFLNYSVKTADVTVRLNQQKSVVCHGLRDIEDWEITLAETGEETEKGARIFKVRQYLGQDKLFSVTYGDGLTDLNLGELAEFHKRSGLLGTMTAIHPPSRYGVLAIKGRKITRYREKPKTSQGFINGGFMIFNREVIDLYFDSSSNLDFEKQVLAKMARDGVLGVFKHRGFWLGMDTPKEYLYLNKIWAQGKAPWEVWQK
ncbi:MAG: glucose-1-phosphate cytidylyltransferase [Candidatus Pacebacteria bacterium]|nr:glucose-1-phosphate cytidylyltransferase [Candidatus Paceibacterota bacterium]